MFEFDAKKDAVVITNESVDYVARVAEEAMHEKACPDTETLLSLAALTGIAATDDGLCAEVTVDEAEFLHDYSRQIVDQHENQDHSLKERLHQLFTGRVAMARSVSVGFSEVLAEVEQHEDRTVSQDGTQPQQGHRERSDAGTYLDELESLDPITIAASAQDKRLNGQHVSSNTVASHGQGAAIMIT